MAQKMFDLEGGGSVLRRKLLGGAGAALGSALLAPHWRMRRLADRLHRLAP